MEATPSDKFSWSVQTSLKKNETRPRKSIQTSCHNHFSFTLQSNTTPLVFIKGMFFIQPSPPPPWREKKTIPNETTQIWGKNLPRCQFFTEDVIIFFQPTCQWHLEARKSGPGEGCLGLEIRFFVWGGKKGERHEKHEIRFFFCCCWKD